VVTAQVFNLKSKQRFVPSEPDGTDPVEVEQANDLTPRTDREQAIHWAGHQAGWADHFAFEEQRTAEFLAKVDQVIAQHTPRSGRHLKPVS
jgi:hypothetical protein